MQLDRALKYAAGLYAVGLGLHTVDHVRRGLDVITSQVFWAGNASTLIGVTAVALVFAGHRLAPVAAVWAGIPIALGVASVHLLPKWSALSDSFPEPASVGVTGLSWTVVSIEIAGALAVGLVGLMILRRQTAVVNVSR